MRQEIIFGTLLMGIVYFQAGCDLTGENRLQQKLAEPKTAASAQQAPVAEYSSEQMHRRFEPRPDDGTAQGTLVWAQRYEELSLKNNLLREKNSEIQAENSQLKQQLDALEKELGNTKKELAEANEFLQQMHLELNEWKTNVLGFRDEMRQAQKGQLEALAKILRVLGAEPMAIGENESDGSSKTEE